MEANIYVMMYMADLKGLLIYFGLILEGRFLNRDRLL